jgi:hypothetical protein
MGEAKGLYYYMPRITTKSACPIQWPLSALLPPPYINAHSDWFRRCLGYIVLLRVSKGLLMIYL